MSRDALKIGIMFSTSGSYAAVGAAMRAGAELAIEEVNADAGVPVRLEPIFVDPAGVTAAYAEGAAELLRDHGVVHVFGCYTSSSRKEVLPVFEKHDALLWYPSHYEGFETSDNVIYTGAAPNQHIVPLARYLLSRHGDRGWCVGSNYVWAWENNRILREALMEAGGTVIGERCFPVGETDLDNLARQIVSDRPDFIFTTLIGESSYQFFRQLRTAAEAAGIDQAAEMPVASCSLSEVELPFIGEASAGICRRRSTSLP
jgi:urea transport system substrate-binding protein